MPRKMLDAGERARVLAAFDPGAHQAGDPIGVRTEGAGLHDGVVGQDVEVPDRREHPVDPHRARLLRRHRAGPADHGGVFQRRERERRRKLGEPRHLLAGAALEIGGDEQGTAGPAEQVGGETADRLDRAAEHDESTDPQVERVGDARRLVAEATVGGRAERGKDEAAGIVHCCVGGHAGVTIPSTRGPLAPVAADTLPGCPWSVR